MLPKKNIPRKNNTHAKLDDKHPLCRRLRKREKMELIGQLMGGIAHDFNNLLMVIQGNLELLAHQCSEDEKAKRRINAAIKATENGAELTKRLLAFSRRQTLHPESIQPDSYIHDIFRLLEPTLGATIQTSITLAHDIWPILADPGQLENALFNLAVNAKDAMKTKGNLRIDLSNMLINEETILSKYNLRAGEYVKIAITDDGMGMPPHIVDQVFEPFFTTKEVGKGNGLGLSMVYGFIKQSKGHITIHSELYHGTTITLFLPRAKTHTKKTNGASKNFSCLQKGAETILVVEDETELRKLTVDYLKELGYQVYQAKSAPSAMKLLQKNKTINLLFSDIVMPGFINGSQLAQQAQKMNPQLKVLLSTGFPRSALLDKNLIQKKTQVLVKPYKMQDLSGRIRAILDS